MLLRKSKTWIAHDILSYKENQKYSNNEESLSASLWAANKKNYNVISNSWIVNQRVSVIGNRHEKTFTNGFLKEKKME